MFSGHETSNYYQQTTSSFVKDKDFSHKQDDGSLVKLNSRVFRGLEKSNSFFQYILNNQIIKKR